jgi:pterin-4a-carbinolamine dehydratase
MTQKIVRKKERRRREETAVAEADRIVTSADMSRHHPPLPVASVRVKVTTSLIVAMEKWTTP